MLLARVKVDGVALPKPSLAYLGLGLVYWFRMPIIGLGLSAFLFSCAWVFSLAGRQ